MRTPLLVWSVLAVSATTASAAPRHHADALPPVFFTAENADIDIIHHDFDLTITPETRTISGKVTITATALANGVDLAYAATHVGRPSYLGPFAGDMDNDGDVDDIDLEAIAARMGESVTHDRLGFPGVPAPSSSRMKRQTAPFQRQTHRHPCSSCEWSASHR